MNIDDIGYDIEPTTLQNSQSWLKATCVGWSWKNLQTVGDWREKLMRNHYNKKNAYLYTTN